MMISKKFYYFRPSNKNIRMKKFTLTVLGFFAIGSVMATEIAVPDTLLYEGFDGTDFSFIENGAPNGNDITWINFDADGLPDGSPSNRPGEWYVSTSGFADVDANTQVIMSNSWTNDGTNPVQNYLILPPLQIVDNTAMLYFKSAPRQTPKYLDGLKVVVSTSSNIETSFTNVMKVFAEYTGEQNPLPDSSFNSYSFSSGFVFGSDGQYIQYAGDSARFIGELRPDSISLAQFAGQTIYIAFLHETTDDNLMSLDDILVTGTNPNSIRKMEANEMELSVYPNPASNNIRLSYNINRPSQASISITSIDGKVVLEQQVGFMLKGTHFTDVDVTNLPAGNYLVNFRTLNSTSTSKLVITK
jgi:hypothetical protein